MPEKPNHEALEKEVSHFKIDETAYQVILENISDTVIVTDDHGNMIYVCPNSVGIFGVGPDEIIEFQTIQNLMKGRVCDLSDLRAHQELLNIEWTVENSQGETRFLLINVKSVNINQGTVLYVMRDITDRKQQDRNLKKYRAVISSTPDGIALLDDSYRYVLVNDAYENFSGGDQSKFIGLSISEYLGEDVFVRLIKPNFDKCLQGETINYQEWFDYPTLGRRYVDITYFPYRNDDNQISGLISNTRDITDRKRAEEHSNKLQAQLLQAKKMESIGTLAGGIAHDFNNVLSPIIGFTELSMKDLPKSHPVQENLKDILDGAKRARDLVKQILLFSRQKRPLLKPTLLKPVVEEALTLIRSSIPKNIDLQQELDEGEDLVLCDATQVHSIVLNLCTNAHHALEDEGGLIKVGLKKIRPDHRLNLPDDNYICLSVQDDGIGIPSEDINKIFEPYYTLKNVGKGSGLGLSVVHGIVKNYQGDISVKSAPGKGSVFRVFLPITENTDPVESENQIRRVSGGTEKILFVDDEKVIVKLGARALMRHGYEVSGVHDGLEALALIQSNPDEFDLVITDMAMPGMVGSQLAKKILEIRPDMPIIICSGYSQKLENEKSRLPNIKAFIDKPILMTDLAETVREILNQGKDD